MQIPIITNQIKRYNRDQIKPKVKLQVMFKYLDRVSYFSASSIIQVSFPKSKEEVNYINNSNR
jgi:hypothetical protein